FAYAVTPTSVQADPSTPRPFAGVDYDGTTEFLRLAGTNAADVFKVRPSLDTEYLIDGNAPQTGTVAPEDGDFLDLDQTGTTGAVRTDLGPGSGFWIFTSGHKPVRFSNIERVSG